MKKFLLPVLAVPALLLSACSTTQLAGQAEANDDVYYTEVRAKEIPPVVARTEPEAAQEKSYRTDEQLYRDDDYSNDRYSNNRYNDDYYYDYSSRINRFYYNSPWRPYYDWGYSYGYNPWYTYDPFFYDPWLFRPGVSLWVNYGYPRSWMYNNYGYYGAGFNNGFWGPYSYYNTYPGYGYGGGYYSDNNRRFNSPNYRPRPNRGGSETYRPSNGGGTVVTGGQPRGSSNGGTIVTGGQARSPREGDRVSRDNSPDSDTRVSRTRRPDSAPAREGRTSTSNEAPAPTRTRTERPAPAPRERYTPPPSTRESYSPPPSNSGSGSSSGGGGRSSGGSSGGSGRPSRGGN